MNWEASSLNDKRQLIRNNFSSKFRTSETEQFPVSLSTMEYYLATLLPERKKKKKWENKMSQLYNSSVLLCCHCSTKILFLMLQTSTVWEVVSLNSSIYSTDEKCISWAYAMMTCFCAKGMEVYMNSQIIHDCISKCKWIT